MCRHCKTYWIATVLLCCLTGPHGCSRWQPSRFRRRRRYWVDCSQQPEQRYWSTSSRDAKGPTTKQTTEVGRGTCRGQCPQGNFNRDAATHWTWQDSGKASWGWIWGVWSICGCRVKNNDRFIPKRFVQAKDIEFTVWIKVASKYSCNKCLRTRKLSMCQPAPAAFHNPTTKSFSTASCLSYLQPSTSAVPRATCITHTRIPYSSGESASRTSSAFRCTSAAIRRWRCYVVILLLCWISGSTDSGAVSGTGTWWL